MAGNEPFGQLTGPLDVWFAPVGEAVPVVNVTPAGNWVLVGATTGEQSLVFGGPITPFYDNDHQGPVKGVVPQEDPMLTFVLANTTIAHVARILDDVADLVTDAGPPATSKMPLKRGYIPNEYALLFRGDANSPFGAFPGMYVIPRALTNNEMTQPFGKEVRADLEVEMKVIEDDNQAEADRLGWWIVQSA